MNIDIVELPCVGYARLRVGLDKGDRDGIDCDGEEESDQAQTGGRKESDRCNDQG
jgi:hypothetical protein